jgi:hypothetical protein
VTSAQVAAFGEKGNLFATSNLLLAGNQLLWSFIDPLLRFLGIDFGMSPSPIAWLAPLGSMGFGAVTAGRFQHVRFLADVTPIPAGIVEQRVPLLPRIAPADRDHFASRTDVLVTARTLNLDLDKTTLGTATFTEASVENGTLVLTLNHSLGSPVRVAWLVDTGLGGG